MHYAVFKMFSHAYASVLWTLYSLLNKEFFRASWMDGSWVSLWELASAGLEWCQWPNRSQRFLNLSNLSLASAVASLSFPMSRLTFMCHCHFSSYSFCPFLLPLSLSGSHSVSIALSISSWIWIESLFVFFFSFWWGKKEDVPLPAPSFYSFILYPFIFGYICQPKMFFLFVLSFHTPLNSTLISPCESQQQCSSFVPLHRTMW